MLNRIVSVQVRRNRSLIFFLQTGPKKQTQAFIINTNDKQITFVQILVKMNLSLVGRTAIVSGSTQGIGFACAIELALLGANCVLLARNEESLQEVISRLDISQGQHHKYLVAD